MPRRLRGPYIDPLDYAELGRTVPALAPHLNYSSSGYATLDFKDEEAVRALNIALLERDFGLHVTFPEDRLCPSVPGRLDYVIFCLDLVRQTRLHEVGSTESGHITGIDVGTGASAIYPLLATRFASRFEQERLDSVRMLATDINTASLAHARQLIDGNGLTDNVRLFQVDQGGPIFPPQVTAAAATIDITMCNPPFYSSAEEIASSSAGKELPPFAVCTAAENELITPGGEVAFVGRMIEESVLLGQHKIRWFTSLLGKYSSVAPLVQQLKDKKILNYHVSALPRRGRTVRWVLCWSLQEWRVPPYLVQETSSAGHAAPTTATATATIPSFPLLRFLSPSVAPLTFGAPAFKPLSAVSAAQELLEMLKTALTELVHPGEIEPALEWFVATEPDDSTSEDSVASDVQRRHWIVRIAAWRNVWSRQARRAAKTAATLNPPALSAPESAAVKKPTMPMFEVQIEFAPAIKGMSRSEVGAKAGTATCPTEQPPAAQTPTTYRLEGWWIRGSETNRAALIGLWGFLTRRIGDECRRRAAASEENRKVDEKRRAGDGGDEGREKRRKVA